MPVICALIAVGGAWYAGAAAAILAVAALEFQRPRFGWTGPMSLIAAASSAAMAAVAHADPPWVMWTFAAALVAATLPALARPNAAGATNDWLWAAGALAYAGLLGSTLVLVRDAADGRAWTFMTVLGVFAVDTAAYFTGRALGRHALAPRISPKKTVEGFLGGYAAGFAAVVALNYVLGLRLPPREIVPLALLLPGAAALGDLAESAFKRSIRIKDASGLIPGHGGVLDRLDSMLFAFALVFIFQRWVV